MDDHKHEHDHGAVEPGTLWVGMLAGLLIGGLAGAVAMLLLAPQSGKRTRAKLRRQSHELREQIGDTVENVEDAMADASDKGRQFKHDVRKQAEKLEKRGHALVDGQKEG